MAVDWMREAVEGWEGRWPDGVVAHPNFMAARYLATITPFVPPDLVYEDGRLVFLEEEEDGR